MNTFAAINAMLVEHGCCPKDKPMLRQIDNDWVELTTPHLDRHNDYLQVYVRKDGDGYVFSDDGYTINDLLNSGCALDSPERQALLQTTLVGFGAQLDGERLLLKTTPDRFALEKRRFIRAMMVVPSILLDSGLAVEASARPRDTLDELLVQCDADAGLTEQEREWLDAPAVGREII